MRIQEEKTEKLPNDVECLREQQQLLVDIKNSFVPKQTLAVCSFSSGGNRALLLF